VHLELFPEGAREWLDERLERDWERLLEVRREVAKALETARQQGGIGSGLEARVAFVHAPEDLPALLQAKRDLLATLFIVSRVGVGGAVGAPLVRYESQEIPGLVIDVERAPGRKCARCWTWSERVGESREHPTLCERCLPVIARIR
jgi:isoleucyl-tRNA synthetase